MHVSQQRVSFLKAWLIYGVTAIVFTIIATILNGTGSSHPSTLGTVVFSGLLGIGINLFAVICVYIHMKEINMGVLVNVGNKHTIGNVHLVVMLLLHTKPGDCVISEVINFILVPNYVI